MAELVELLQDNTPESLEKVFTIATQEKIVALDDDEASKVVFALRQILEDTELISNAKVKRRVTRLISSIENRSKVAQKLERRQESSQTTAPSKDDFEGLETTEIIARFERGVNSKDELESLLNVLKIPPRDPITGEHSKEFLIIREPLKNALDLILNSSGLTGSLHRRVSRLKFSFLTPEEKEEEKKRTASTPKSASQKARNNIVNTNQQSDDEVRDKSPVVISFKEVISSLKSAITSDAVETAIASINFAEIQSGFGEEVREMKRLLDDILADEVKSGNAKLRRRLGRMRESMDKVKIADVRSEAFAEKKSFAIILSAVEGAKDAKELEASLRGLPSNIDGEDEESVKDMMKLEKLLIDIGSDEAMVTTAPQRRKLKRTMEALSRFKEKISGLQVDSKEMDIDEDEGKEDKDDTVLVHNPKPGPPLEGAIKLVRDAASAEDLESAVKGVKPGYGNNKSRRTLKRALENIMNDKEKEWVKDLNSKARRGITRVIGMLGPVPDSGVKAIKRGRVLDDVDALAGLSKKVRKILAKTVRSETQSAQGTDANTSNNPYILFVGQLSFGTKKEHLEKHLSANGVQSIKNIRILTDNNGNSRGMAFVELQSAEDMHKGLSIHHSVLHGRRLNVEKSCGGRNKEARQVRIASFRDEQAKAVAEKIDEVIADFEGRGVITRDGLGDLLLARLHSYSARQVSDLLSDFEKRPKESRSLRALDQICNALNEKLGRQNISHGGTEVGGDNIETNE